MAPGAIDKHIMVIEDSPDLQALLGKLLKKEGFTVTRAFNGREALTALSSMSELPRLILLDVMMPEMDGLEFRDHQLKDAKIKDVPVVVMTADSNSMEKVRAMGVSAIMRKPIVDIDLLLETISEHQR